MNLSRGTGEFRSSFVGTQREQQQQGKSMPDGNQLDALADDTHRRQRSVLTRRIARCKSDRLQTDREVEEHRDYRTGVMRKFGLTFVVSPIPASIGLSDGPPPPPLLHSSPSNTDLSQEIGQVENQVSVSMKYPGDILLNIEINNSYPPLKLVPMASSCAPHPPHPPP